MPLYTTNEPDCTNFPKGPGIILSLDKTGNLISELLDSLNNLEKTLDPVLLSNQVNGQSKIIEAPVCSEEPGSSVNIQVMCHCDRLTSLIQYVNRIQSRVNI